MKIGILTLVSMFMIGSVSQAMVRPGTSIKSAIEGNNRAELSTDLDNLGIDNSRADVVLDAVKNNVITAEQLGNLLAAEDKKDLVRKYVEELLPAAVNAGANNLSASSLMTKASSKNDLASNRKAEIAKIAQLIVGASKGESLNMDNMPAIMEIVQQVAEGKITEEIANAQLTGQKLVTLEEGEDALKALRDCD
jgi:hypothetical protein